MWLIIILWTVVLAATVYLYFRQTYSYYEKRGVKTEKVTPFVGHMGKILLKQEHISDTLLRSYRSFPGERFVGRYEFTKPVLVVRDVELIKKIVVKDFDHFVDHRQFISKDVDPIFGRILISMKGNEWRDMRSALSPAFTSSKIRHMVPFMVEVGDTMVASMKKKIKESKGGYLDEEVKDLMTRYANDVIASCAFGLRVDSHTDRDNQFYKQGLLASTFKFKQLLIFFLFSAFPFLMKTIKIPVFSPETRNFFKRLVLDTMKHREDKNVVRPDMIHLLMEAKKGQLTYEEKADTDAGFATVEESAVGKKQNNRAWDDDDLIAQAVIFLLAGFETVSSAMVFMLYELALNPDVQDRLAEEIRETDAKNGGKFDFNSIQNMTYMDMVVSETLRLWPPAIALDRQCVKDYNLGKPNDKTEKDYIIREGEGLQIPTWALHHDPEFFPNPDKFDPERFSEENRNNIHPFSYSPFGLGPRNCIGSRFALCEMKVMAYQLLLQMEVVPGPKTCIPAKLDTDSFNIKLKGGHWLRFKIRPNNILS